VTLLNVRVASSPDNIDSTSSTLSHLKEGITFILERSVFLFQTSARPLLLANEIALTGRKKDTLRSFAFQDYFIKELHCNSLLITHDDNDVAS
jgi:hypothetical protein